MPDQADNLRQLLRGTATPAPACWSGPPMIVVTAARPGIGVTTVAVNLAAVLADGGARVLLVDANEHCSNMLEMCDAQKWRVKHTLAEVMAGRCALADAIASGPAGVRILAGSDRRRSSIDTSRHAQQRFLTEMHALRHEFDLVVIDLGSGLNAWTRRFWLQALLVLLVTNTDSSALMDTYAAIKRSVADGLGPDVRLVVNRSDDEGVAADVHRRLSHACGQFLNRTLPAVPPLPRHEAGSGEDCLMPRIWEDPHSTFGHAMLWLARAVDDVLAASPAAEASSSAA